MTAMKDGLHLALVSLKNPNPASIVSSLHNYLTDSASGASTAIPPDFLPQPPGLGGPSPTLSEEVMVRLPPAAAAPPALARLCPLGAYHSPVEEEADGGRRALTKAGNSGLSGIFGSGGVASPPEGVYITARA